MIRNHDRWSKMGEKNLGSHNIEWAKKMEEWHMGPAGHGPMTLMKAIINDYWADCDDQDWSAELVNIVMSKLYWCWVAWIECNHFEAGEEE